MSTLERSDPGATIIVVGASLAGLRCCEALRGLGFLGRIVVVDAETAPFYDRPPLSKQFLAGTWDVTRLALRSKEKLASLGLELELGLEATEIDLRARELGLADGRRLGYDGLVVATGSSARRLPAAIGGALQGVLTLRSYADAVALREAIDSASGPLVVVGGGFLGMEVAASVRSLGAPVSVVEPLPAPLARVLGPTIGAVLVDLHAEHGVDLRLGTGVEALEGERHVERVVLGDGSSIEASAVLVAVGAVPSTRWLEGSGLELDDGLVCDESLVPLVADPGGEGGWAPEGRAPGLVAAGDLVRWPHPLAPGTVRIEHWTNAAEQGAHAASSLLGAPGARRAFAEVPYFWSDQYDLKIQALGLPVATDDLEIVEGSLAERRFIACYGRAGSLTGVVGFASPRRLMAYRPLLVAGASFDEALAVAREAP